MANLGRARIYFGHPSVGAGILQGASALLAAGDERVRIVETEDSAQLLPGVWAHSTLGHNGDPLGKLEHFAGLIASPFGAALDLALVKLCYADVQAGTDHRALFERYAALCTVLGRARPRLRLVHVTVPLTTIRGGPRAWGERALGRAPGGARENAVRHAFNELLRTRLPGPVFDLAEIEASRPDGTREELGWQGRAIPALAPEYAADEGHLNEEGRRRVARRLLEFLAAQVAEVS